jgi:DNA-binding response OmpR family regulator
LIVEDQPAILRATAQYLDRLGYRTFTATQPQDALHLVQVYPDEIRLVLTDVLMPGMSGPDLAREIGRRNSRIRVLFMSGHTADAMSLQGASVQGARILTKPFSNAQLAAAVHATLYSVSPNPDQPGK